MPSGAYPREIYGKLAEAVAWRGGISRLLLARLAAGPTHKKLNKLHHGDPPPLPKAQARY